MSPSEAEIELAVLLQLLRFLALVAAVFVLSGVSGVVLLTIAEWNATQSTVRQAALQG